MKIITVIFFYLFCSTNSKLEPLSQNLTSLRYSLSSCVLSAANEFMQDNLISISLTTMDYKNYTTSAVVTDQVLLKAFHKEARFTILIVRSNKPEGKSEFFKRSDEYIIQIRDIDEVDDILETLMKKNSWNPHARFMIITTTIFPKPYTTVSIIFKYLWKQKVLNAIIMLPTKENTSLLNIYSWFPYRDGQCGENYDRAFIINKCNNGKFEKENLLFPEKIPLDMNNCPVKIRAVIWPPYIMEPPNYKDNKEKNEFNLTNGIEILLMNTVAAAANFRPVYSISPLKQDWGILLKNGTATGMMKTLMTGEANIGIGAMATLTTRHLFFDSTEPYIWESVTWCVPHSHPIGKWQNLVNTFSPITWISILISYLIVSVMTCILSRLETGESNIYKQPESCFLNIFSMLLCMAVKTLPRLLRIRFIISIWVLCCLNLNTAFTSTLIRELTHPSFEPQVSTVEEMVQHGYSFGLVPPTSRFFSFEEKVYYSEVTSWHQCNDVKLCLDRTAYKRDFAVGIPRMYMQYASHKYITKNGRLLLFWTDDDIVSYPVEIVMTKGFPLQKRINTLVSRIKEAGLISKWSWDFLEKADNVTTPVDYANDDSDIRLTQKHLEGAFILLIIGLGISAVVFIGEWISKHKVCRRKK